MTALEIDRAYERETDRLIEEHFGTERKDAHSIEAFKDAEIALRKIKECRTWLDEALAEDPETKVADEIGSYYEEVDDLAYRLECALEKLSGRRF